MDSALHCICGVAECAHLRACKEQFTMFVRPDHPQTTATAVIHILNDCIHVSFPEIHNAFNELVKSLGYRWKAPCWQRAINARAGTIEDRSAELAHRLLSAGFCVQFPNDLIQTKAIAGDYAHEHTRWILRRTSGEYADWFVFEWSRADDLYKQAMRLTGARYRNGNVIVPDNHYDEVLDFADHLGFRLTEAAQALADEARARWESALVVAVPKPKSQPLPDGKLRLPENLDIANELADHD